VLVHERNRVAEVSGVPGLHVLVEENVGHRIRQLLALLRSTAALTRVRRREWPDLEVAELEGFSGPDMPDDRQFAEVPLFRLVRPPGEIDWYPMPPRENARAPDMIGVLVGDQDPFDIADIGADGRNASLNFRTAQAGVDQHGSAVGLDKGAIAGAAAGEDVDFQKAPPAGWPAALKVGGLATTRNSSEHRNPVVINSGGGQPRPYELLSGISRDCPGTSLREAKRRGNPTKMALVS